MRYQDIAWPDLRQIIPAGISGDVRIEHDEVTKDAAALANVIQASQTNGKIDPGEYLFVEPGPITRLLIGNTLFMSDARMERITSAELVLKGAGHVLIAGLGLGLVLHPLAAKSNVRSITVVEKNPDVLALVKATVPAGVRVIEGDIFKVQPSEVARYIGGRFDSIFFDIWPTITTENLPEMARLHRRFSCVLNTANPKAWMTSWMYDYLRKSRRRRERKRHLALAAVGGDAMCTLSQGAITCKMAPWV